MPLPKLLNTRTIHKRLMVYFRSFVKSVKEISAPTKRTEFSGVDNRERAKNVDCKGDESASPSPIKRRLNGTCYLTNDKYSILEPIADILDPKEIEQKFDLHDVRLEHVERDWSRLKEVGRVTTGAILSIIPPHIHGAPFLSAGLALGEDTIDYEFLS